MHVALPQRLPVFRSDCTTFCPLRHTRPMPVTRPEGSGHSAKKSRERQRVRRARGALRPPAGTWTSRRPVLCESRPVCAPRSKATPAADIRLPPASWAALPRRLQLLAGSGSRATRTPGQGAGRHVCPPRGSRFSGRRCPGRRQADAPGARAPACGARAGGTNRGPGAGSLTRRPLSASRP